MAISIAAVQMDESGLSRLSKSIVGAVAEQETKMRDSIAESIAPDSTLIKMPEPVLEFLEQLEQKIKTPEERATFEAYKETMYRSHQYNVDYVMERVDAKSMNANIKMALGALQKTTSAIQQILNAQ